MIRKTIAADIGSKSIKLGIENNFERCIITEESCIVVNNDKAIVGNAALDYNERIYPIQNGNVANPKLAAILLRMLIRERLNNIKSWQIDLNIAVPESFSDDKREQIVRMSENMGYKHIAFYNAMLAAALGAGIDIYSGYANLIVDLGAQKNIVAAVANGGILCEQVHDGGGHILNNLIVSFIRNEYGLIIGNAAAEFVKSVFDNDSVKVVGINSFDGSIGQIELQRKHINHLTDLAAKIIAEQIIGTFESLQPDAASDIFDNGITLVGGGALLFGLERRLEQMIGIRVKISHNNFTAAVDGFFEKKKLPENFRVRAVKAYL